MVFFRAAWHSCHTVRMGHLHQIWHCPKFPGEYFQGRSNDTFRSTPWFTFQNNMWWSQLQETPLTSWRHRPVDVMRTFGCPRKTLCRVTSRLSDVQWSWMTYVKHTYLTTFWSLIRCTRAWSNITWLILYILRTRSIHSPAKLSET